MLSLGSGLWAQNSDDSTDSQSWTATSDLQNSIGANPVRSAAAHTQSGNRTTDTNSLQRVGLDGRYDPYLDVEKETVKLDATTVRTIQRSYAYADGQRHLVQTTQEESHSLPGGEVKTVRTTSNPDSNGGMQVVQKEIEDTRDLGGGVQQTTKSVFMPNIDGSLSESLRTQQRDIRTDDHTVQFQKTTMLNDGSGNWLTSEVRQGVIRDDGKNQTREETVSQPDSDGKLAVVRREVSKQALDSSGAPKTTSETYSVDLPGVPRESNLYPVQRVTTTTSAASQDGEQSTQTRVEQPNPGSPTEGMQITVQTTDNVRLGPTGVAHETRTIESFNDVGNPNVVWVDIGRSDKPTTVGGAPAQPSAGAKTGSTAPAQPKQ
jgi:hypothetical protein